MALILDNTIGGSNGGKMRIRTYLDINWQNAAARQTSVRVRVYLDEVGNYPNYSSGCGASLWLAGQYYSVGFSYDFRGGGDQSQLLIDVNKTIDHDANGNATINVHPDVNCNNSPYVTSGWGDINYGLPRLAYAPQSVDSTATNITDTTATLGNEINGYGNGTSAAMRMWYRIKNVGSYASLGDQGDAGGYNYWYPTGLTPNERYQYYAQQWNNNGDSSNGSVREFVTLPSAATIGTIDVLATTATMPYTQATDGAEYAITTQYRVKPTAGAYGDWTTATGGTIALSGLLPNTSYTIQTRSTTTAGTKTGSEYEFTTLPAGKLVYPNGDVKNAITRLVYPDATPTVMVNINLVREE